MYVGELSNLIGVALFVIPLWFIYQKRGATRRAGVEALACSVVIRTAFACFCNACITLPLYAAAMGVPLDEVVRMVGAVNPAIHDLTGFIILATVPFNIIKIGINYTIGHLLYTRLLAARIVAKTV